VQHKARLNEEPTQVEQPTLDAEQEAIVTLWEAVFRKTSCASTSRDN